MKGTHQISFWLNIMICFCVFALIGCFVGISLGNHFHKNPGAEIGNEKIVEQEEGVATAYGISYEIKTEQGNGGGSRATVKFNNSYFSNATIQNFCDNGRVQPCVCYWGTTSSGYVLGNQFSLILNDGYAWPSTTSFTLTVRHNSMDDNTYNNPTNESLYYSSEQITFTRNGNNFTYNGNLGTGSPWGLNCCFIDASTITAVAATPGSGFGYEIFTLREAKAVVKYNKAYFSSAAIQNFSTNGREQGCVAWWGTTSDGTILGNQFRLILTGGYRWPSTTSYSLTVRATFSDDDAYDNPTNESLYDSSSVETFTRSGNTFSCPKNIGGGAPWLPHVFLVDATSVVPEKILTPVAIPTHSGGSSHTFNGGNIIHGVSNYNTNYMTRSGTYQATYVGTYTIYFTLKSDYCWSDYSTGVASVTWYITPITLTKPSLAANPTYAGGAPVYPTLNYYDNNTMSQSGSTSATVVNTSGNYALTISLRDTSNYQWSGGGTGAFNIYWNVNKLSITIPSVSDSFTYDGVSHSATISNMNSTYINQGGTATTTNANTYTVTFSLKDTNNTQWSGGSTAQQSGTWTISRRDLSGATVTLPQYDYTYDGSAKTPTPSQPITVTT